MDIFEFALQMENDGKNLYLELAEKVQDKGMRTILRKLAQDEEKHYKIILEMRGEFGGMAETGILADAKNIFAEMKDRSDRIAFTRTQIDLYVKARDIEEKSVVFYDEKAALVEDERHSEIFAKLAEEERKHLFLLEKIVEFVSRPYTWLENAEFNHLDDY